MKSIDVSNFITIYSMFEYCDSLTWVDISNFDILISVDISNFDTRQMQYVEYASSGSYNLR